MWFFGMLAFFLDNNLINLSCISLPIHGVSAKFSSDWRMCHIMERCKTSWDTAGKLY